MCEISAGGGITTISPASRMVPEPEMPVVSGCVTAGCDGCGSLHPAKKSARVISIRHDETRLFSSYGRSEYCISTNESVNG
jgi:hypothetical protein